MRITKTTVTPTQIAYTVEASDAAYVAIVSTTHPICLGVVLNKTNNRECRKTATREAIAALVLPDARAKVSP